MIILDTVLDIAANVTGAVKGFISLQLKKLDLKNTAAMQQAADAQREAAALDKTRQALAGKDLEELRKEAAE